MTLTPKNWKSFQHYTNRSPAWIKLHRGLLDDYAFHRLPLASRALAPMLWLLASEYEDGIITASEDEICFRLHISVDDVRAALKPLIDAGFFICDAPASTALAECKRDACLEKEEEEEIEKNSRSKSTEREPSRFDEFWQAYPRRDGPNPRKPAETKFNSLVKTGIDPRMLINEARNLAQAEAARGNIGTRFIPQAVTWLSQQRWSDHAAVAMAQLLGAPALLTIEDAVSQFAKLGRWSRHAPCPEPGQSGCIASPELLARYGLAPDGRKLISTPA